MPSLPEEPAQHARTPVLGALLEGWRRVLRAPALAASILAVTFLCALPMAAVLRGSLEQHLGSSLESEKAAREWNAGWAAEFGAGAKGIERTFTHEILGFGGTMAIVSDWADNERLSPALAGAVAAYLAVWVFLSGGILDRLARGRPIRASAFFAACGVYFLRFLRLAVVAGVVYWALFRWLHPYLLGTVYNRFTRDETAEGDAIAVRAGLYVLFFAIVAGVNLVMDFAKVRAVVEDRRSMLGALASSLRFIRRRPGRVVALYLLNLAAFLIIVRLWLQVAPAAEAAPWVALLIAQIYLLARVWAKLAFMASETVFFQGELAHAHYAAAPEPLWPDSPAAEAIENLVQRRRF